LWPVLPSDFFENLGLYARIRSLIFFWERLSWILRINVTGLL
jgi:hypothetical protein